MKLLKIIVTLKICGIVFHYNPLLVSQNEINIIELLHPIINVFLHQALVIWNYMFDLRQTVYYKCFLLPDLKSISAT